MAKQFYTEGTGNQQILHTAQDDKIPVYETVEDAEADLPNLEEGQIIATEEGGGGVSNSVENGDLRPVTSNAVSQSISYSTTEQKTGGVWIDGKTIYRKVVDFGNLPNATTKDVAHNISNFGQLVKVYGTWYDGTWYNPLPFAGISSSGASITMNVNATYVKIQTGTNRSSSTGVVTIEYTKTTD